MRSRFIFYRIFSGEPVSTSPENALAPALDHLLLDLRNRLAGVQSLGAGAGAVENGVTAVESEWVFEIVQPFAGRLVAGVCEPTPGLEEGGGPQEAITVPPVARAARRAAETENAFVITVKTTPLLRRLQPLLLGDRCSGMKPRLDHFVLREHMGQVRDEVLHDHQIGERINRGRCRSVGDEA